MHIVNEANIETPHFSYHNLNEDQHHFKDGEDIMNRNKRNIIEKNSFRPFQTLDVESLPEPLFDAYSFQYPNLDAPKGIGSNTSTHKSTSQDLSPFALIIEQNERHEDVPNKNIPGDGNDKLCFRRYGNTMNENPIGVKQFTDGVFHKTSIVTDRGVVSPNSLTPPLVRSFQNVSPSLPLVLNTIKEVAHSRSETQVLTRVIKESVKSNCKTVPPEEEITILDVRIRTDMPKDPRITTHKKEVYSSKLLEKMLCFDKRIEVKKWFKDVDEFLIYNDKGRSRSSQFGNVVPRLGPQSLFLIPWSKIEDFQFSFHRNPCLDTSRPLKDIDFLNLKSV